MTRPSHWAGDGTFRNPWPADRPAKLGGALRWWLARTFGKLPADPGPAAFRRVAPTFRVPRAPSDVLTATWIGHSTVLLQIGGRNVLTDPMFGERASPVAWAGPRRWVPSGIAIEGLPPIDGVLLSHNHYDHFDRGSVGRIADRFPDAPWIVPSGLAGAVRAMGARDVRDLDWWEEVDVAGLAVSSVPARHFSARSLRDRNRTLWCGFAVAGGGRRLLFAGDTGHHPELSRIGERLGPFDLMLLPIGAYEPRWFMKEIHMNPEEAVVAFLDLGGRTGGVMGGIHWGTFKLTDEPMDEPPERAKNAWRAAGLPPDRLWIPVHGETLDVVRDRPIGTD